jgi:hypothetical protein
VIVVDAVDGIFRVTGPDCAVWQEEPAALQTVMAETTVPVDGAVDTQAAPLIETYTPSVAMQ